MAQLILTKSSQFHRAIRTGSSFPMTLRIGKFFLLFSMTFAIGLLSFFYLVKFTEIHTKGYQLRKLEIERDHLQNTQELQSTNISKLKSLALIRSSDMAMKMVPMQKPVFLREDGSFAKLP